MSDTRIYGESVKGVGCDVVNCKYHTNDNACGAKHIVVQNGTATRKAETFCSTFEPGHTAQ